MRKWTFILLFGLFAAGLLMPTLGQAQRVIDYQTSAGLRLSPFYGVSIKHFFEGSNAVEGLLHSSWNAVKLTGLYERHQPAFDEPGLQFYYGGGGHLGFFGEHYGRFDKYNTGALLGIDGIVGLEYTVQDREIPLNASVDWKPVLNFSPFTGFYGAEVALTVRYIFQ